MIRFIPLFSHIFLNSKANVVDDGVFVRLSQNLVFLKRYFTILPLPQGPCPNAPVSFAITAPAR